MFKTYTKEAELALELVETAAGLCRRIQGELVVPAVSKADRSPVTVADFVSQAVIAHRLVETFPELPLVAEEDSRILKREDQTSALEAVHGFVAGLHPGVSPSTVCEWIDWGAGEVSDRFWTLDPIDGTKGFLRGEQYVVELALVEKGRVAMGAMGCPNLDAQMRPDFNGPGSVVVAVRGEGAWSRPMGAGDFHRLGVSDCAEPGCVRMLRSFESSHTDPEMVEKVAHELGVVREPVLMDSAAKYGLLAGGQGELILRLLSPAHGDYVENIWDHAAGALIVEEAGGRISDLAGKTLDFGLGRGLVGNVGLLVSNGPLHEAILEILARFGVDQRPGRS